MRWFFVAPLQFRKTSVFLVSIANCFEAIFVILQKAAYDYEHSELLLYQNMVIQESGDSAAALEHLDKYREQICDKPHWLETRADLLMAKGEHQESEKIFTGLVKRNPENHAYYRKLESASQFETVEQKLEMYKKMREAYPKSAAPQRLPLEIAKGMLQKNATSTIPPLASYFFIERS